VQLLHRMKKDGLEPSVDMYNMVMDQLSYCEIDTVKALFVEMKNDGINPDLHTFHIMIRIWMSENDTKKLVEVGKEMVDLGIQISAMTVEMFVEYFQKKGCVWTKEVVTKAWKSGFQVRYPVEYLPGKVE